MSEKSNALTPDARSIGWAGFAAIVACAACCAVPLIVAAGVGGTGAATIARVAGEGAELVVGAVVFVVVLAGGAIRARARRRQGCGTACLADGGCCERGASRRA